MAETAEHEMGMEELCCSNEAYTAVETLSLLADVPLASLCGKHTNYSCVCDTCCCLDEGSVDSNMQPVDLQLHFFLNKADNIQRSLSEKVSGREEYASTVKSFLFICQPYFLHLESTARSPWDENNLLSESMRSQMFDFSQILCNKLENLVLTCASKDLLPLDETEPDSITHFYIGQCGLGSMTVTIFRYCQPTPYLAEVNTGLYKRMRWNVDHPGAMEADDTEYYFLCCEDVDVLPDGDNPTFSQSASVRMWSIGQWLQVSPETEDINDWTLCRVPQGTYLKRVILGREEPSCCIATDCLLQLLMLDQK
ncbi:unnamed protein product [Knipowitschia caucasica]|uniref:Uncharacterized protein n=1 Tax=Knipowitschia caucasica TaxID=637954 RepID=A0AAV2LH15_KNICA